MEARDPHSCALGAPTPRCSPTGGGDLDSFTPYWTFFSRNSALNLAIDCWHEPAQSLDDDI